MKLTNEQLDALEVSVNAAQITHAATVQVNVEALRILLNDAKLAESYLLVAQESLTVARRLLDYIPSIKVDWSLPEYTTLHDLNEEFRRTLQQKGSDQ